MKVLKRNLIGYLMRFGFEYTAARAPVECYQLPAFDIKLLAFIHDPFMKTIFAEGFAFILIF